MAHLENRLIPVDEVLPKKKKNERGNTLVAGAENLMFASDPLHAEASAMFHAVQEAVRMDVTRSY
jgi:hypothetical protein